LFNRALGRMLWRLPRLSWLALLLPRFFRLSALLRFRLLLLSRLGALRFLALLPFRRPILAFLPFLCEQRSNCPRNQE
jgi:hypothetical protein